MRNFFFLKGLKLGRVLLGGIFLTFLVGHSAFAQTGHYKDNRDGTVTDTLTGRTWVQNPENVPSLQGNLFWIQARDACRNLVWGGHGPGAWRLPRVKELQSITTDSGSPRLDTRFFSGFSSIYWSNTNYIGSGSRAWTVNFDNGRLESHPKFSLTNPVRLKTRCVRD